MNSIVYHLRILSYSMQTLHRYFPWAIALHLYNMADRGEKLQQLHCYHPFYDSMDMYLTKNHYENYLPKMVPIAKIWGSGSWTCRCCSNYIFILNLTSGFNGLGKDNDYNMRREAFKFWDLVLILETLRYTYSSNRWPYACGPWCHVYLCAIKHMVVILYLMLKC